MNVSIVTSASSSSQTSFQEGVQDFESLANALQSGDLSSAQSAFSSLEQNLPGISQVLQSNSSSSSSSTQTSPVAQALQSLQSALQSGDLSGAQQAFTSLEKALQSTGSTHRGHHHHRRGRPSHEYHKPNLGHRFRRRCGWQFERFVGHSLAPQCASLSI